MLEYSAAGRYTGLGGGEPGCGGLLVGEEGMLVEGEQEDLHWSELAEEVQRSVAEEGQDEAEEGQ